jgi:16S rRNA (cytosine1402-N4)-methyltransferase
MSLTAPAHGAWDSAYHAPVLVDEVVSLLGESKKILDCTLGGGGHSAALLALGANVTAIDRDPQAIAAAHERLATFEAAGRFRIILGNFAEADRLLPHESQKFDGILADLGLSSHQIDSEARGFSFREGALLDMRMEPGGENAADLLNNSSEEELIRILRDFGDEPKARRIAREIVRRRDRESFTTSDHLVNAIRSALGPRSGPGDFARIFQAFRIAVNAELESLERALPILRDMLVPNGVMAIISYHSGEDRIVKHVFQDWARACVCPPQQPICNCRGKPLGRMTPRKPLLPEPAEIEANSRARSAKLRIFRKATA